VAAQTQLRALGQQAAAMWSGIDVLLVPTAPTHYTIAAMQADPVALNRNLGAYTNFVNLLDYAALSVPSSIRPDGLPFGITLIGPAAATGSWPSWASATTMPPADAGCHRRAFARAGPIPGLKPGATRACGRGRARTCRACR
jgi:hypothetical protein